MYHYLIILRELFMKNFGVSIKSLQYKENILYNNYFFYFFRLIPFYFIQKGLNILNLKYIYTLDDIYFSNYDTPRITPALLNVKIYNSEENTVDITDKYKKYNQSVPFWYLIENENISYFEKIQFKYFHRGKIENKEFNIQDIKDKLLHDIF